MFDLSAGAAGVTDCRCAGASAAYQREEVVQTHNTDRRAGDDKVLLITTGDTGSHDVRGGPNSETHSTYSASTEQEPAGKP